VIRRRTALLTLAALLALVGVASTATNLVAPSRAGARVRPVTANELKPPECASLDLEEIRVADGGGGAGHAGLVLGTNGNDRIIGGGGPDCIVAGAGNDDINAGGGFDICLGGPGTDTLKNCEVQYP
jgi:Ca2+-binding RTX toxin-like protein